jgi:hypothetical protein
MRSASHILEAMKLKPGNIYNWQAMTFLGWKTERLGSAYGYHLEDYFNSEGRYKGPDEYGIEPILEGMQWKVRKTKTLR